MTATSRAARPVARAAAATVLTAALAAGAVLTAAPAGAATDPAWRSTAAPPQQPPVPSEAQLQQSTRVFTQQSIDASVRTYTIDGVSTLETTSTQAGATTITLASDILFAPDLWDVGQPAADRIGQLVADVPEGAEVEVSGHTDVIVGAVENQQLSQNRADAVAAVVAAARPDLVLRATGYADTRPAVTENPEDAATLAANRRVEITYAG
ncbi:OmpA family protein [Litorihabitans aurantiacus]|uniref:OmpA-like domain-containing protein n=1 Tax=Litorihabitans aurantiacus TaxID=1930061 RepID=A0AA37USF6_9MICO|nr:OmpA family protein [Litorihabitans aurantiacus]GMA31298.1 hypothetical protein GCM10025875_12900 [Litorihabitans aurantiacus]